MSVGSLVEILSADDLAAALASANRGVLRDALRSTRLLDAFRAGRLRAEQARRAVGRIVDAARAELADITRTLVSGASTLSRWFGRMVDHVIPAHLAAALALLGTPEPPPADAEEMRALVNDQGRLLGRFATAIRLGAQALDGTAVGRAMLYGAAAWGTAEAVVRGRTRRDGYREERRVLDEASKHCLTCPDQAEKGWVPIGTLLPIGQSECGANCRCWFEYR